jgi:CheY-like chemotaxis protein/anti-sigma regulatory factor (Ser/Thr protein kinase)
VLDISRIEAGNLQLSVEPVSLAEVLEETLDLMRPLASDRSMELAVGPELEEEQYVRADRQRLKQVLLNLLTNAVKYTPVGGKVKISVDTSKPDTTRVIVADTGQGIPTQKLARLFTPFDRLGAEQSGVEGTGLGLALCQRLMQAMDGAIGVRSDVGKGSAFWIELPGAKSPLEGLPKNRSASEIEPHSFTEQKRKVLYIEDNFSNLTLVEQMLAERSDLQVITAMQGQLGLDLARKHLPDVILLDLHLPDLPGWEVLARLRRSTHTQDIPVIIISADATARQVDRLMAAGARAYLTKPLDITELFRAIDETISVANKAAECAAA